MEKPPRLMASKEQDMTTTNRVRAGQPAPIVQLHRVDTSQIDPDDGVTVTPIQFAGDEPDEDGLEEIIALAIVQAPIPRRFAEEIKADDEDESDDFSSRPRFVYGVLLALALIVYGVSIWMLLS
jgi:hypothetical protein